MKAISKAAGDCCSRLPRQQRQKEPQHPQSWALQSSLSSHVRCVGEWRLWFLCLCRPVGFISGCTALLPDILLQRRHLLFSSRNLTSVCDQSLPVKRKKGILIRSCGCPWVCRGAHSAWVAHRFACGFPVSITAKILKGKKKKVGLKLLLASSPLMLQHRGKEKCWIPRAAETQMCHKKEKKVSEDGL